MRLAKTDRHAKDCLLDLVAAAPGGKAAARWSSLSQKS
jgi:hypothetical protein